MAKSYYRALVNWNKNVRHYKELNDPGRVRSREETDRMEAAERKRERRAAKLKGN